MGYLRTMTRRALNAVGLTFRADAPAYNGASTGRRMAGWNPAAESINSALFGSVELLRARSRDIARKNPYAINAIDSFVANTVGTGIKPQLTLDDADLKKEFQEAWLQWTDEADADGLTDFYGLESLIVRAIAEGGEVIVRIRRRYLSDGLTVPLQLQVIEPEHLPVTKNEDLPNGNKIRAGIEFDQIGRRVAYHLYREHPGSGTSAALSDNTKTHRIPASEVLHIYRPLRPGQMRGQPWLSPVLATLYDLEKYDDATLLRQQIAAMFAGFITEAGATEENGVLAGTSTTLEGNGAPAGIEFAGLEPGTMQKLLAGEDIKFSDPPDAGATYEAFMRVQLRKIAAGLGITYEQLAGDLSGVNYSSIRAGLLEFRRRAEQFQHQVLVYQFCRPVMIAWIEAALLAGVLPLTETMGREYRNVRWVTNGWAWVDPLKDITAKRMEVRSGFSSRSAAVAETGEDSEQIDQEQATDNERADELGLKYDSDGRRGVEESPQKTLQQPGSRGETVPDDEEALQGQIDRALYHLNGLLDQEARIRSRAA